MWECRGPGATERDCPPRAVLLGLAAQSERSCDSLTPLLLPPLRAAMTSETTPRPLPTILANIRAVHQRNAQQMHHDNLCTEMSNALTAKEKEIERADENKRAVMQQAIDAKDALVQSCKAQLKALADLALGAAAADVHLVAKDKTRVPAQKSVLKKAIPRIVYGDLDVDASAGAVRLLVALLYCKDFPIGDDAELGLLIEACELATMWSGGARPATDEDPDEMVSVLQKLSEPLVAKAKESAAGAVAVLVAAERHHGHTAEDPAGPFWEKAEGEAQRALVNFEGTFRSSTAEELGELSLGAVLDVMPLVKAKKVALTITPDLNSEEFTSGNKCCYASEFVEGGEGSVQRDRLAPLVLLHQGSAVLQCLAKVGRRVVVLDERVDVAPREVAAPDLLEAARAVRLGFVVLDLRELRRRRRRRDRAQSEERAVPPRAVVAL